MNKKIAAIVLCIAFVCTGCLASRSPDEYGYVLIIGVDEGDTKPFYVSMLLQRSNGSADNAQMCSLTGVECTNLFEAVDLLESGLPFSLDLSRTTAMVFSYDIAQNGHIEEFLAVSLGTLQIRYYANLIVSYGSAQEYLSGIQSELNPNIAKLQYSFVQYSEATGLIPTITLAQFYDRAWSGAGDVALPLGTFAKADEQNEQMDDAGNADAQSALNAHNPYGQNAFVQPQELTDLLGATEYLPDSVERSGGLEAGMIGCAVFRGTTLAGILNGEHTQALLIATGQFNEGRIHLPLEGKKVSVQLIKKDAPSVRLTLGERPYAQIHLTLYALLEQPTATANMEQQAVERAIGAYLEGELKAVYLACKEQGADVFSLGKAAVTQFTDTKEWEAYSWADAYKNTDADFFVDVSLTYNPTFSRLE